MAKVTFDIVRTWIREHHAAMGAPPQFVALTHDQAIELARDLSARWEAISPCRSYESSKERPSVASIMATLESGKIDIAGVPVHQHRYLH